MIDINDILKENLQFQNLFQVDIEAIGETYRIPHWMIKNVTLPGVQNTILTIKYFSNHVNIPRRNSTFNDINITVFDNENLQNYSFFLNTLKDFYLNPDTMKYNSDEDIQIRISTLKRSDFEVNKKYIYKNIGIRSISDIQFDNDNDNAPAEFNVVFAVTSMENEL